MSTPEQSFPNPPNKKSAYGELSQNKKIILNKYMHILCVQYYNICRQNKIWLEDILYGYMDIESSPRAHYNVETHVENCLIKKLYHRESPPTPARRYEIVYSFALLSPHHSAPFAHSPHKHIHTHAHIYTSYSTRSPTFTFFGSTSSVEAPNFQQH